MDSFEPLDLSPLSLDDEDDKESFQSLQLPQVEKTPKPSAAPALSLTSVDDDDEDAEADQWANKSLDKYRLPPLKPDESLAVDDMTPDFAAHDHSRSDISRSDISPPTGSITERLPPFEPSAPRAPAAKSASPSIKDVPEFSLSNDEYDQTEKLEIESPEHSITQKARPAIVRELLRDPDFTVGGGAVDLSSAGRPAAGDDHLEEIVRKQVSPQLERLVERAVERAVEKAVAQLLPAIAERIIKRELERLLDES